MIITCKLAATTNLASAFEREQSDETHTSAADRDKLQSQIGQLVSSGTFLCKRLPSAAMEAMQRVVNPYQKLSADRDFCDNLCLRFSSQSL